MRRSVLMVGLACLALGAASTAAQAKACNRIVMSDVAFGKTASIAAAKKGMPAYAEIWRKRKGWKSVKVGPAKAIGCAVYLDFGIATEYRCKVAATVCDAG
ncbi:MAG: hypothetical protein AAFR04_08435 [Pseudomonadota bacterium]